MANVILDGVTYNGVDKVSLKDADNANQRVEFQTPPTLVTKNISANGTYAASSDNADGFSSVTVAVAPPSESDVNFYDYDGTLVAAYTAADFANLTAMPANPMHTGLVAEGWNWTLSDAKTYVASYGMLDIGQLYHTASGKTEYDVEINDINGFTATLNNSNEKDWGDGTIDTNTSHTYSTAGNYTIKLSGSTLPNVSSSKKLRAIRLSSSVSRMPEVSYNSYLRYITVSTGLKQLDGNQFSSCQSLQFFIAGDLGNNPHLAFGSGCVSLKGALIRKGRTSGSLQSSSFNSASALHKLYIPEKITTIQSSIADGCRSLTKIIIPEGVTTISQGAFQNISILQKLTLPSTITSIGNNAFNNDYQLKEITILATTPPTVSSSSFLSSVTKIYIPNGTLATYTADTNWSTYASKLVELPA